MNDFQPYEDWEPGKDEVDEERMRQVEKFLDNLLNDPPDVKALNSYTEEDVLDFREAFAEEGKELTPAEVVAGLELLKEAVKVLGLDDQNLDEEDSDS